MRYSASEKFEIIELVERLSLSIPRTLAPIGIPRSTFYDWYSRYQEGGIEALEDGKPRPRRIWNKLPDKIETAIVNLALEEPDLSPRELAVNFTVVKVLHRPRLLSDNGPSYVSSELGEWLDDNGISGRCEVRSPPCRRLLIPRSFGMQSPPSG
jgi:transposase-like protein